MSSSTRWLERAVDHLDVALLLVGLDRRVSYANAATHRLFGVPPGLLRGASLDRLTVPERRGELRNIEAVLGGGGARKVRSVVRREDGSRVDVTMILEPCFDEIGNVVAVSIRYDGVAHMGRPSLMPQRQPLTGPPLSGSSVPPEARPSESPRAESFGAPAQFAVRSPTPGEASAMPSLMTAPSWSAAARVPGPPPLPGTPPPPAADGGSAPNGRLLGPAPVSRASQMQLTGVTDTEALSQRLTRALRHLHWLDERLSLPVSVAPLDDARERARALLMVGECRELLEEALGDLGEPYEEIVL